MPRDSAGNMTLAEPAFVAGTTIVAADVNSDLADIRDELTDSLSRSGKGGLLSSLRFAAGTLAAPGIAWVDETSSGWYRVSANIIAWVIAGVERMRATTTGAAVTGTLSATSTISTGSGNTLTEITGGGIEITGSANALIDFKDSAGEDYDARIIKPTGANLEVIGTPLTVPTPVAATDAATKGYVDTGLAARPVKAWALLTCGAAGAVTVTAGLNVASASYTGAVLTVTFTSNLSSANYAVSSSVRSPSLNAPLTNHLNRAVGSFDVVMFNPSTQATLNYANNDVVDVSVCQ